jgi:hypothetical protein
MRCTRRRPRLESFEVGGAKNASFSWIWNFGGTAIVNLLGEHFYDGPILDHAGLLILIFFHGSKAFATSIFNIRGTSRLADMRSIL